MAYRNTLKFAGRSTLLLLLSSTLSPPSFSFVAQAADYREAEQLYFLGRYAACAEVARGEVERGVWHDK